MAATGGSECACGTVGFRCSVVAVRMRRRPRTFMRVEGCATPVELDRTDVDILRALQEDARLSYRDLAKRVGGSVPTISARIATLGQHRIPAGCHAALHPG